MKANPIIIKRGAGAGPGTAGRGARVAIPGVIPSSSRFGEQVVKLRVPSLDSYIGGGVPIGSICIIRDELPSKFGDMILKSFIADGATYNHCLFIASGLVTPASLVEDLPSIRKASSNEVRSHHSEGPSSDMKIAWRYGHDQSVMANKNVTTEKNNSFDFSKKSTVEELGGKNVHLSKCCDGTNKVTMTKFTGEMLLEEILKVVDGLELSDQNKPRNNVARIVISHCEEQVLTLNFMMKLKSIVLNTNSCAVITVSSAAYPNKNNESLITLAEHFADIVISLQIITDLKRRNELGGIDGVCDIKKVASNNTLKPFEPPKDVGFSFKKKRLLFHELHLPPEGENTTQREVSKSSIRQVSGPISSGTCGSTIKGKSIDF